MKVVLYLLILNFVLGLKDLPTYKFNFENANIQEEAVKALIRRILPEHFFHFKISIVSLSNNSSRDMFQIFSSGDGEVFIKSNSGVGIASGLNYYLKYYCHCQITWQDKQLNLPSVLPKVNETISFNDQFRYYQNICTSSYSFVWWDWKQWEKHMDWIALNSFNLVLAPNGQEYVWNLIYKDLGMTQEEIDRHFTGPAFLAWNRMGNLRSWGGPLSSFWHNKTYALQKQILLRMKSLGIIPVFPGFAGHVPRAFKRLFPKAKLIKTTQWNKFNDTYSCPYLIDPEDDLFQKIGEKYYEKLQEIFEIAPAQNNMNNIYSADIFNEMPPTTDNLTHIGKIANVVYETMTKSDSGAIWLMQGWLFYSDTFWTKERAKALITGVPLGKMIILDLQSEQFPQYDRLDSYFGQPYIWCMLHNFGGTLGMFGSANIINSEPFRARSNTTMIGIGLTPEGINQNYVMYDLISEMAWRKRPSDLTVWFENYSKRRYGQLNMSTNRTWQILKESIYNFSGKNKMRGKYSINTRPSLSLRQNKWYKNEDLFNAFVVFLDASESLFNSETYKYDIVDFSRQVLQLLGDEFHQKIIVAFKNRDISEFKFLKNDMLELFDDLELILQSNENFLLGRWLQDAKSAAEQNSNLNHTEKAQFEYNARNQITLWGPTGEIRDYANKQWAGVVSDYFKPRWLIFLDELNNCLKKNIKFNETFVFHRIFVEVEQPFTFSTKLYSIQSSGDSVDIARYIRDKWTLKGMLKQKIEIETSYGSLVSNFVEQDDIKVILS